MLETFGFGMRVDLFQKTEYPAHTTEPTKHSSEHGLRIRLILRVPEVSQLLQDK